MLGSNYQTCRIKILWHEVLADSNFMSQLYHLNYKQKNCRNPKHFQRNMSSASALSSVISGCNRFFSSLCLHAEIKMSSQKTPPPCPPTKKRERKVKFKETKSILIVRSSKTEPSTESKRNFAFYPLHSKDQNAHWLGQTLNLVTSCYAVANSFPGRRISWEQNWAAGLLRAVRNKKTNTQAILVVWS